MSLAKQTFLKDFYTYNSDDEQVPDKPGDENESKTDWDKVKCEMSNVDSAVIDCDIFRNVVVR